MAKKPDIAEVQITTVAPLHFRVVRKQADKNDLLQAYARVKEDTKRLETAIDNNVTALSPTLVTQVLVYLLALGRLVIALSIKVHKLENKR